MEHTYAIKHLNKLEKVKCLVIRLKKILIRDTVLKPPQVSKYQYTKVNERITFKELGKLTL